jgi:hypothetical protein
VLSATHLLPLLGDFVFTSLADTGSCLSLCVCSFVKTFRETRKVEYTRAMVMSLAVISVFMLLPGPAQDYLVDYTVQVSEVQF